MNLKSNILFLIIGIGIGVVGYFFIHLNIPHTHESISDLGRSDKTYDLRFLRAMISHHLGAIEMANNAITNSDNDEVKNISKKIVSSQNLEIALMGEWKKEWYNDVKEVKLGDFSLTRNLGTKDEKYNLRYLNAMIVHHEGAIDMCKDVLVKSTRNQVLTLCNDIISSQSQEIEEMSKLRAKLYNIENK